MGATRNGDKQQCLDKMGQRAGGKAGVYFCHGQGGNQVSSLYNQQRNSAFCVVRVPVDFVRVVSVSVSVSSPPPMLARSLAPSAAVHRRSC
jgi:hypothetical protein